MTLAKDKEIVEAATPGKWVYDNNRDTHDSPIYVEGSTERHGYIGKGNGGVVGSSEWIWLSDDDGKYIAHFNPEKIKKYIAFIEAVKALDLDHYGAGDCVTDLHCEVKCDCWRGDLRKALEALEK